MGCSHRSPRHRHRDALEELFQSLHVRLCMYITSIHGRTDASFHQTFVFHLHTSGNLQARRSTRHSKQAQLRRTLAAAAWKTVLHARGFYYRCFVPGSPRSLKTLHILAFNIYMVMFIRGYAAFHKSSSKILHPQIIPLAAAPHPPIVPIVRDSRSIKRIQGQSQHRVGLMIPGRGHQVSIMGPLHMLRSSLD